MRERMEKEGFIVELSLDDDMGHMIALALHHRWPADTCIFPLPCLFKILF
jgi:hypothetical protein